MEQHANIYRLDQADVSISRDICTLFQRAYGIEAQIVGADDFPPLKRTPEDIQLSNATFTGLFDSATLAAVTETRADENCLFVDSFVVDPQFFRKGFGSQLLQFILEASQCDTAFVETAAANEPAICFYKRFGFTEIDRWQSVAGLPLVKLGVNLCFSPVIQSVRPEVDC